MPGFWPNGARAAVSLTYDDGKESHLDIAIPDLAEFGARATFFLAPGLNRVTERAAEWRKVALIGHEIANHTMTHELAYRSPEEFVAQELEPSEQWLDTHVSVDRERTFTYPYGRLTLEKGVDYRHVVANRFAAARGGSGGPGSSEEARADRFNVPASACTWAHDNADTSIAHMEAAPR